MSPTRSLLSPPPSRSPLSPFSGFLSWLLAAIGLFVAAPLGPGAVAWAAKCPNLQIVLDRSGSMSSTLSGGKTRWQVAVEAARKVLDKYDGKFPIGMSIFPGGISSCGSELVTPPVYKSRMKIQLAMDASGPNGSTPSGSAVRDAAMIKELRDPDRKQYILLITDGGPGCGGEPDSCTGTVSEIKKALAQTPNIATFVVGFGGGLSTSEQQCLTEMAAAGGKPDMTALKFYKADSAEDLNKALSSIIEIITGGGDVGTGGLCDDTCYSNGCPTPGDICVRGECRPSPCAGLSCPAGSYCYTDGTSEGTCARPCLKSCPTGSRCNMGTCISDPCSYACPAGLVCDASLRRCVKDPLCGEMPVDEQCRGTSSCRAGQCVDDPCRYIRCPANTRCVGWEGTCDALPTQPMEPTEPADHSVDVGQARGCSSLPGAAGGATSGLAALGGLILSVAGAARRRRSRQPLANPR